VIVGIHKEFLMKKLSHKSVLLFGAMLAVCAFVPSMASAASWSPLGSAHTLLGPGLAFTAHTSPLGGPAGSSCATTTFGSNVASANTIEITSASFVNCMGSGAASPCTATVVPTGLPWTATATSTTNVQIHGVQIDLVFENTPGAAACPAAGAKTLLTGTLSNGSWSPATNTVNLAPSTGLSAHFLGTGITSSTTIAGTISDQAGTLRMFM
jgi:hypothetical protein